MTREPRAVEFAGLRRLHDFIGRINGASSLMDTLQAVVEGVVEVVGFEVAAINYLHLDETFEVLAVAGDVDAREQLLGQRLPAHVFEEEFGRAEQWGDLRFVPHERYTEGSEPGDWIPVIDVVDRVDAWHPLDALFAPLVSPAGDLVGVLSVDLPRDRKRPGILQRQMLEMFAAQAGIAISNARLTERLKASEESFRLAFEQAGNGMALLSLRPADFGRFLRANAALCRMFGRTNEELLGLRLADLTHPDDRSRDLALAKRAAAGNSDVDHHETRFLHANGNTLWAAVTSSVATDGDGSGPHLIVQVEDVGDRRAAHEELTHWVGHDDLTGLPNRRTFEARLAAAVDAARLTGKHGALLFCDLDGFKVVNDTHGHSAGDRVLIVLAQRLAGTCRGSDTVARLGGDEFVVLAENTTPHRAMQLSARLQRAVASPVVIDRVLVRLTVSIGMAVVDGSVEPTELMQSADSAMYRSKRNQRDEDRHIAEG